MVENVACSSQRYHLVVCNRSNGVKFAQPQTTVDSLGVSGRHRMYDDRHMLKVVQQHATASALNNQEAIATFLLLLNWTENSTNAACIDNKDVCTIFGTSQRKVCATCHFSTSKAKHHPCQYQHGACVS